jgi:transcriptional regulator with XRE-family HTH domain
MTPNQLKEARHALGLTLREMAHELSDDEHASTVPPTDPRTIRRWEAGDRDIPHAVVKLVRRMMDDATV